MEDNNEEEVSENEPVESSDAGKRKRLFHKERAQSMGNPQLAEQSLRLDEQTMNVRCMMFGFGDDQCPYTESVDFLEDLVVEYITEMTLKAMEVGKKGKVHCEDIVFLIRKDPKKYARVKDLLTMNEELKKARKAFDAESYGEIP